MLRSLSIVLIMLSAIILPRAASAEDQVLAVFLQGTWKVHDSRSVVLYEKEYICTRLLNPTEGIITESYMAWIGMDKESLQEFEVVYTVTDDSFTMESTDGWSEASGSFTGRRWSWQEIEYSYIDSKGQRVKIAGDFSGRKFQRAMVVTDTDDEVVNLTIDKGSMITNEEFLIMEAMFRGIQREG